jgi:DNA-binding NarL/FixJ family response regulator
MLRRELVDFLSCEFEVLAAVIDGKRLTKSAILLNPDVIVCDIFMPLVSGPQAMQELRTRGLKFPFVFIGADAASIGDSASFVSMMDLLDEIVKAIYTTASGRIYTSRLANAPNQP